jgi:hypothetical protein
MSTYSDQGTSRGAYDGMAGQETKQLGFGPCLAHTLSRYMKASGAPTVISLLSVSSAPAQPSAGEEPASGAAHDGHNFGAWLFPVERLNQALPRRVQLGGEFRSRFEGEEGIRYTTTNAAASLRRSLAGDDAGRTLCK